MGPDVVDDGSDLVVGHAVAKARHSVAPLQHHRSDIGGRGDLRIVGQRRIDARALGALAMGHVATLAGRAVEGCTVGLDETWSIRHFRRHGIAGARGWYRRGSQADGAPHQGAGETKMDRPHWHAVLVELMRGCQLPDLMRACRRCTVSSADSTAPSCQAGRYEACSPASARRPSIWQRFL